jgi:hypothetical protein
MSAALNALGDVSRNDSLGTHPDLSLGSFTSGISGSPARPLRVPSSSTLPSSTALTTPSPPGNLPFSRKASAADGPVPTFRRMLSTNLSQHLEEADGAVLNTPDKEKRRWDTGAEQEPTTPKPGAARSKNGKPGQTGPKVPTLRDQEKVRTLALSDSTRRNTISIVSTNPNLSALLLGSSLTYADAGFIP